MARNESADNISVSCQVRCKMQCTVSFLRRFDCADNFRHRFEFPKKRYYKRILLELLFDFNKLMSSRCIFELRYIKGQWKVIDVCLYCVQPIPAFTDISLNIS